MGLNKDERTFLENVVAVQIAENRKFLLSVKKEFDEIRKHFDKGELDRERRMKSLETLCILRFSDTKTELHSISHQLEVYKSQSVIDRIKNLFARKSKMDFSFVRKQLIPIKGEINV